MENDQMRRFVALDSETFTAVVRQFGLASAACYRLRDGVFSLVLQSLSRPDPADSSLDHSTSSPGSQDKRETSWPPAVSSLDNYTSFAGLDLPFGWVKSSARGELRKIWRKGTHFYFPVQDLAPTKLMFAVQFASPHRYKEGELHGALEALGRRIGFWVDRGELTHFVNETTFQEHVRGIGVDLRNALDHEIRTPLSSVVGYANLLTIENELPEKEREDYLQIISTQAQYAVEAIDKLSVSLSAVAEGSENERRNGQIDNTSVADKSFDLRIVLQRLCERLKKEGVSLVGEAAAAHLRVGLKVLSDKKCAISGSSEITGWAIWEVLKNAAIYARGGNVTASLYRIDRLVVVDIEDDGGGVAHGAEDLIFLRFYQDPSRLAQRHGKRGLGLGLYLARYLAERNFGELKYVRVPGKVGLFRFVFPALEEEKNPLNSAVGA